MAAISRATEQTCLCLNDEESRLCGALFDNGGAGCNHTSMLRDLLAKLIPFLRKSLIENSWLRFCSKADLNLVKNSIESFRGADGAFRCRSQYSVGRHFHSVHVERPFTGPQDSARARPLVSA